MQMMEEFVSVCPDGVPDKGSIYYAFFSKDPRVIRILNDVIRQMTSEGTLQQLNERYFGDVSECPI